MESLDIMGCESLDGGVESNAVLRAGIDNNVFVSLRDK